jgi:YHS domain-containing protein
MSPVDSERNIFRKCDSNSKLTSIGKGKEYFFKNIRSNQEFLSSGK